MQIVRSKKLWTVKVRNFFSMKKELEEINLDHSKVHEEQEFAGGLKISWVADGRRNICQKCFVEKGCV